MVTGDGPNLLGRDMLQKLEVDIGSIQCIHTTVLHKPTPLEETLQKYPEVFSTDLGCMTGIKVNLLEVKPKFHKPRTVPFVLRGKVEAELERLQSVGASQNC